MMRRVEQFQAARWARAADHAAGHARRARHHPAGRRRSRSRKATGKATRAHSGVPAPQVAAAPAGGRAADRAASLHAPVADDHGRRRDAGHDGHLHHEVQPEGERPYRPPAAAGRPAPAAGRIDHPGPAGDPLPHEPHHVRDRRHGRVQLPARAAAPRASTPTPASSAPITHRAASSTAGARSSRQPSRTRPMPPRPRSPASRSSRSSRANMAIPRSMPSRPRSPSARPASCSPAQRIPASSIRNCASSSTSCTRPAASPPTTRPTATACSASSAPATSASTCASSTCTRPSRPRTASIGLGCAAVGVKKHLAKFLPNPIVAFDGKTYRLDADRPEAIDKIRAYLGNVHTVLKAYAWVMSLGADGSEGRGRDRRAQQQLSAGGHRQDPRRLHPVARESAPSPGAGALQLGAARQGHRCHQRPDHAPHGRLSAFSTT